jgi:hypothetical protein
MIFPNPAEGTSSIVVSLTIETYERGGRRRLVRLLEVIWRERNRGGVAVKHWQNGNGDPWRSDDGSPYRPVGR